MLVNSPLDARFILMDSMRSRCAKVPTVNGQRSRVNGQGSRVNGQYNGQCNGQYQRSTVITYEVLEVVSKLLLRVLEGSRGHIAGRMSSGPAWVVLELR